MKSHKILYKDDQGRLQSKKLFAKGTVVECQKISTLDGKMMRKAKHLAGKKLGIQW